MQVFKLVLSCLDVLQICPFLYVIRLVGWLKHRNLSLRPGYCLDHNDKRESLCMPSACLAGPNRHT